MTNEGFQRALLSFARRKPLLPFQIEFMSGDLIRIVHPEAVRVRGNIIFYVAPTGHQRLFDSTSVCQLRDDESNFKPPTPSRDIFST